MIYFHGKALETIAPVRIEDIRVSPIQLMPLARQRAIRFGSDYVRMDGGNRTVSISFALLTNDTTVRQKQLMDITAWARTDKPDKLVLPYHDHLYLECACTALPEPSTRQWWESKLTLVFTTFGNPYWTSIEEKSAPCGTAFYVGGNAPPLMEIRHTLESQAENQSWSDGTDTMTFEGVPAGELTIDLNRQIAKDDTSLGLLSLMGLYVFGSRFIIPKTGAQTITGIGTVYWRERWE